MAEMIVHHSADYSPLLNDHRQSVLSSAAQQARAEQQVFSPRRFGVDRVETKWTLRGPIKILHLNDGMKLVFNPLRPGIFVYKPRKGYVRALHPHHIQEMNDCAYLISKPRMRLLHKWLKWFFPLMTALGVPPASSRKVFLLDKNAFVRYYQPGLG